MKKTAEATAKAAKKTAQETKRATFFVVRHWKGCLLVGGIAFIVLLLFGGLSSCSLFGGNSGSGLIASSYLSRTRILRARKQLTPIWKQSYRIC